MSQRLKLSCVGISTGQWAGAAQIIETATPAVAAISVLIRTLVIAVVWRCPNRQRLSPAHQWRMRAGLA